MDRPTKARASIQQLLLFNGEAKKESSRCSQERKFIFWPSRNVLAPIAATIITFTLLTQTTAKVDCQSQLEAQKTQNGSNIKADHRQQSPTAAFIHQEQQQQQHQHQNQQHISSILNSFQKTDQVGQAQLVANVGAGGGGSAKTTTLSSAMLKTFIRTNSMRAYHMDLHSYRSQAKFAGDPSFIDSSSDQHKSRCASNLNQYQQLLSSFGELDPVLDNNSLDSMRLADMFGRPEAGALSGNQFWLGSYESCLDYSHNSIRAQYCLGITQFSNWNPSDSKTSIKIGLCLPETCTSSMINDNPDLLQQVETMMKYQFNQTKPFHKLTLRQVYCLPHETSPIRQYSNSAIAFFLLVASFVMMCLITTTFDYLNTKLLQHEFSMPAKRAEDKERGWKTIVLESFSLIRNFDKFMSIREESPQQQQQQQPLVESAKFDRSIFLSSTAGIKCIGLFWIICAHTFLVGPITSRNMIELDKLTKTYLADIYLTAHLMVDTFFALSGLLASYFIFKEGIDKIKPISWIVLTVHRYWRLTPIYLLCYWFAKSVAILTSSGPMWDYMTSEQSPRLNCNRESWWDAVLHMSDFKSPKDHCVPFAWFIANGIKFWMVTPLFLILINKSMRRGYIVTVSTIFANILLVFYLAAKSKVDVKSVIEFKPESADNMLNNMGEVYTRPYSRIGAYLIGLLAGHVMYMVDTNQIEIKLSKNTKIILWMIFSFTITVLAFILKIASGIQLDDALLPYIFSVSSALIRPLWALCTCYFVFAISHGQARLISRFLSANLWRLLVKLSFCAYLVQGEVIAQLCFSSSTSSAFSYQDLITKPIAAIALTLALSFLMVLFLEYPLIGIEELILPKKQHKTKITPSTTVNQHINGNATTTTTTLQSQNTHYQKLKST